jgi:uncharacterized protein
MTRGFEDPPFLDNLIPVRTGLPEPQTAGWTPGPPVYSGLGCVVHADQMIPVADGISLAADICTPKRDGRYPAVVLFAAYSHQLQATGAPTGTNETGSAPVFTDRGYVHVVVSRRGMGRSHGESGVFFNDTDVADHEAVIDWAARQPWCDGNVVLFGTSYYAMVQPLVAVRRPQALRGFFAYGTDTDYFRHVVMSGGAPQVDFLTLWMGANFTDGQQRLHVPPVARAAVSQVLASPLKRLWEPLVQRKMVAIQEDFKKKTPARLYRETFAQWAFDGKTRATSSIPAGPYEELDRIEVPFVALEDVGAFNFHQFGAYDLFENAGTPGGRKWLILAPPEYSLPVWRWQLEALAFFDHVVHDAANGYAEQPPVRYLPDGAASGREWHGAPDFPVPGGRPLRYHLRSRGADADAHELTTEAPDGGANSWAAAPFRAITPPGLDEVANPILTFETQFEEATELTGPIVLSLRFSCTEIDSHVIARLSRIGADGEHSLLSLGSIRPACRRIDNERSTSTEIAIDIDTPEPLVPCEPVALRFSLTPHPVIFSPGERLRLDLASRTDLLRDNVSHGYEQFDMQVPPYFSRNTIHFGEDSYLELTRL